MKEQTLDTEQQQLDVSWQREGQAFIQECRAQEQAIMQLKEDIQCVEVSSFCSLMNTSLKNVNPVMHTIFISKLN